MNPQTENKQEEVIAQAPAITQQVQQQTQVAVEPEKPENDKEINWNKFKEARAKERKEAEEMAKRVREKDAETQALKAAMEALLNKPAAQQREHEVEEETEEQRIEKRVEAAISKREAANEVRRQEMEVQQMPQRLSNTYKDFNQVCTTENLDYLEYHYPEVASAFKRLPDSFDKWSDIYAAVKRFVPNTERKKDMNRMEQNLAKPQSASKSGLSQSGTLPSPTHLSEERKAANWERMQKTLKGLS